MIIDITKKYTTRSGLPVRIYAVDGMGNYPVHGAYLDGVGWKIPQWPIEALPILNKDGCSWLDLVEEKKWRVWEAGEGPSRLMIRWNNHCKENIEIVHRNIVYSNAYLFKNATWLHEDGSETPCGVEE